MQFSTVAVRSEPVLGAFRSLHLSLNAPVIAIDELPVGPARAGVVLCVLPEGRIRIEIAIRSLRTGEVVAVASDLGPEGSNDEMAAVDAALSYAEGMGFLFDEDELIDGGDAAAEKAVSLWCDLVEDVPERARTREAAQPTAAPEADASIHEVPIGATPSDAESIVIEHSSSGEVVAETLDVTASAVVPAAAAVLTKFRLVLEGNGPGPDQGAVGSDEPAADAAEPCDSHIHLLSRY